MIARHSLASFRGKRSNEGLITSYATSVGFFLFLSFALCLSFALPALVLAQTNSQFTPTELVLEDEYVIRRNRPAIAAFSSSSALPNRITTELVKGVDLSSADSSPRTRRHKRKVAYQAHSNRCAELKQRDPSIITCSPNFLRHRFATPSDSFYSYQWSLNQPTPFGINAFDAWDITTGSKNVVIGILDGGIDYYHPDLADNVWINPGEIPQNGMDDDNNGYVDDVHGINSVTGIGDPYSLDSHGTHVAGIIGAVGNNDRGIAGVAWNVSLLAVNAADEDGYFSSFDIVTGLDYLRNQKLLHGTNIVAINASLGGFSFSEIEFEAIKRLRDAGILFVTAAGNEALNIDRRAIYPAAYLLDNIISVIASNQDGVRASFSNYGFIATDIAAPGVEIVSTFPDSAYGQLDGTSMAAPLVAGALALGASIRPDLSAKELRTLLFSTARATDSLGRLTSTGRILDVAAFVNRLISYNSDAGILAVDAALLRDIPFRIGLGASISTHQKVRRGRTIVMQLDSAQDVLGSGSATIYLQFKLNSINCPYPVKISEIRSSHFTINARTPSADHLRSLTVRVLNGEGEQVSTRRIKVVSRKPIRGQEVSRLRNASFFCSKLLESLRLSTD